MDELVLQAMNKWPNVPDCYGWLGLDTRGHWWMRDECAQTLGGFQSGKEGAKGSRLNHEKLIAFIHRNYESDDTGRWYFQNGPQRVFVELAATPFVWRVNERFEPCAQTGQTSQVKACVLDESGRVYLHTTLGFGLVHSLDVACVAQAIEQGVWTVEEACAETLPQRYGYVVSPQQGTVQP